MDVLQRAPVEVLAAHVGLGPVDDEELGVLHAAAGLLEIYDPGLHAGRFKGGQGALALFEHDLVHYEPHLYAALDRVLDRGEHRLQHFAGLVGDVELLQVQRLFGRAYHLQPHGLRASGVGRAVHRAVRHAFHQRQLGGGGGQGRQDERKA